MKKLKEEILRFISKISSSEMKYNKKLRKKVFNLENHIHEKEATEYIEDPKSGLSPCQFSRTINIPHEFYVIVRKLCQSDLLLL